MILVVLYIRMGLRIRQTSEIQRNLPRSSFHGHHQITSGTAATSTVASQQAPQQQQQPQQQQFQGVANGSFSGSATERHISGSRRAILRMLGELHGAFPSGLYMRQVIIANTMGCVSPLPPTYVTRDITNTTIIRTLVHTAHTYVYWFVVQSLPTY